jgi:hypothetical protein
MQCKKCVRSVCFQAKAHTLTCKYIHAPSAPLPVHASVCALGQTEPTTAKRIAHRTTTRTQLSGEKVYLNSLPAPCSFRSPSRQLPCLLLALLQPRFHHRLWRCIHNNEGTASTKYHPFHYRAHTRKCDGCASLLRVRLRRTRNMPPYQPLLQTDPAWLQLDLPFAVLSVSERCKIQT